MEMAEHAAATMASETLSLASMEEKLKLSEARRIEAEDNAVRAAIAGKELLEKNCELSKELQEERQRRHEAELRSCTLTAAEDSAREEIGALRATVASLEAQAATTRMLLKENEEMRERVEGLRAREKAGEERVEMLEEQLAEANRVAMDVSGANLRDVSVDGGAAAAAGALEEELARAHADIVQVVAAKRELQNELLSIRSEKDELEGALLAEREKRRLAEATLEEKEEELSAFLSTAQDMRQETRRREEEARDMMSVEASSKGNSLFSEVEDRRHIVEGQLVQMKDSYAELKTRYEAKAAQMHRLQVQNVSLLNMAASGNSKGDGDHIKRLEELLQAERQKTKTLTEHLALLENTSQNSDACSAAAAAPRDNHANASMSRCENSFFAAAPSSNNHTKASEYNYLTTMLRETKERAAKLQTQLQVQMRQNLSDGEALVTATRRIRTLEGDLARGRADIYKLKLKLEKKQEEEEDGGGAEKMAAKQRPRKKIFENLKFEEGVRALREEKERFMLGQKENSCPNSVKDECLKSRSVPVEALASGAIKSEEPDKSTKKKTVVMALDAKVGDADEGKASGGGSGGGKAGGLAKGRKKNYSQVIYADKEVEKMEEQCKQQ